MTVLPTLSTRNLDSAHSVMSRAQVATRSADDAQGFAGVLDAFSGLEEQSEVVEQIEESADVATEESDDSAESDQEGTVNGQGAGSGADGGAVDGDTQAVVEGVIQADTVLSAGDLDQLLTEAASIDLAGLANSKMQGQSTSKIIEPQPTSEAPVQRAQVPVETQTAEMKNPLNQPMVMSRAESMAALLRGSGMHVAGHGAGNGLGESGAQAAPVQSQVQTPVQSALQVATPVAAEMHASVDAGKIQTAQTHAIDHTQNGRRLNGVRAMSETGAVVAGKASQVAASESSSHAGNEQSGLDLGSKSQSHAKILSTNASDDRAIQRQQVMAQVQRGLASILNTKGGTMKIRLSPEHLGEVDIRMTTKDGSVRVEIDAKNESSREVLERGLEGLRASMESRGVQVDELTVLQHDKPGSAGFEQWLKDSDDSGQSNQSDYQDPKNNQHAQDESADESLSDIDNSSEHTERGIWTELGLDAIA